MDAIIREHQASPLDLVLHVGDLAYADGRDKDWDAFMAMVEPLASEVPYMVRSATGQGDCWGRDMGWGAFMAMVEPLASEVPYMVRWGRCVWLWERWKEGGGYHLWQVGCAHITQAHLLHHHPWRASHFRPAP